MRSLPEISAPPLAPVDMLTTDDGARLFPRDRHEMIDAEAIIARAAEDLSAAVRDGAFRAGADRAISGMRANVDIRRVSGLAAFFAAAIQTLVDGGWRADQVAPHIAAIVDMASQARAKRRAA